MHSPFGCLSLPLPLPLLPNDAEDIECLDLDSSAEAYGQWTPEGSGWLMVIHDEPSSDRFSEAVAETSSEPPIVNPGNRKHDLSMIAPDRRITLRGDRLRSVGLTTVAGTSLLLLNSCRQWTPPKSSDTPSPSPPQSSEQTLTIISKSDTTTVAPDEPFPPAFTPSPSWTVTDQGDRPTFTETATDSTIAQTALTHNAPEGIPRSNRGFNPTFADPVPTPDVPPPPTPLPPSIELPAPEEPPPPPDVSALLTPPKLGHSPMANVPPPPHSPPSSPPSPLAHPPLEDEESALDDDDAEAAEESDRVEAELGEDLEFEVVPPLPEMRVPLLDSSPASSPAPPPAADSTQVPLWNAPIEPSVTWDSSPSAPPSASDSSSDRTDSSSGNEEETGGGDRPPEPDSLPFPPEPSFISPESPESDASDSNQADSNQAESSLSESNRAEADLSESDLFDSASSEAAPLAVVPHASEPSQPDASMPTVIPDSPPAPPEFSVPSPEFPDPDESEIPPPAIALPLRNEEQSPPPAVPSTPTLSDGPFPDPPLPPVPPPPPENSPVTPLPPEPVPTPSPPPPPFIPIEQITIERINVIGSTRYDADALSQIARIVMQDPGRLIAEDAVLDLCHQILDRNGAAALIGHDQESDPESTATSVVEAIAPNRPLTVTVPDLIQASDVITQCYTTAGYINSGAFISPEQLATLTDPPPGTPISVTIQVVEGSLETINVEITRRDTFLNAPLRPGYVRRRLAPVGDAPFNINELVEAVQLLELDPRIERISTQIVPGTQQGTSILNVEAEQSNAFSVRFTSDNDRSPSVGTFQQGVTLGLANLVGLGDRFEIDYRHTTGSDGFDFSYSLPVNGQDGTVEVTYGFSNSQVIEDPFDVLDIQSDFRYYELRYRQPIVRSPTEELALSLTASRQETNGEFLEALTGTAEPFPSRGTDEEGRTRLSILRFSQDWIRRSPNQVVSLFSEFSLGLDALNATLNDSRPDGRFFSWKSQAQWVRRLATDTVFLMRGGLQIADGPLVPLEQFAVGGQFTVRGYRSNTVLSDNGWVASAEVRLPILRIPEVEGVLQVAPFFDAGGGWNNGDFDDPDPGALFSTGLGLIWRMGDAFSARLDWGIPLTATPDGGRSLQESGIHFSIQLTP